MSDSTPTTKWRRLIDDSGLDQRSTWCSLVGVPPAERQIKAC
jgi:hypothetical protein